MKPDRIHSVNEVTADLERLHGQTVQLAGVLQIEFEGDCLLHFPASERLPDHRSSLWAEFEMERFPTGPNDLQRFNGRRVTVIATINRDQHGHFGLWPGGVMIHNVVKYEASTMA